MAPVLSNYVFQRSLAQREFLNRQITQRETVYSDLIKEASRAYADSMTHGLETPDELVSLYALVSRIRWLASKPVLEAAEACSNKSFRRASGNPALVVGSLSVRIITSLSD